MQKSSILRVICALVIIIIFSPIILKAQTDGSASSTGESTAPPEETKEAQNTTTTPVSTETGNSATPTSTTTTPTKTEASSTPPQKSQLAPPLLEKQQKEIVKITEPSITPTKNDTNYLPAFVVAFVAGLGLAMILKFRKTNEIKNKEEGDKKCLNFKKLMEEKLDELTDLKNQLADMAKEEGVEQIKQSVQNTKAKELLVIIENTNQKYEQLKELYEKCIISNKNKIMKLLLASDGKFVIEEGYKILGIPKDQIHIGYITTASKGATNTEYIKIHKQLMKESGYSFEEIDIENKNESELKKFFSDKNIIHMEGGNTFYLLKAIKKFGFDKILREFINEGKIYIGTSAGTSIMGPDISISSHKPEGISKDELIGLKLVPFLIKCHYTDEKKVEYLERLKNLEYPVRFLRDGQGILVEDDKYTFIGKEDEVIIKS